MVGDELLQRRRHLLGHLADLFLILRQAQDAESYTRILIDIAETQLELDLVGSKLAPTPQPERA